MIISLLKQTFAFVRAKNGLIIFPVFYIGFVVQSLSSTVCDPMNCSMPGFHVLHYLPEFAQMYIH